MWPQCLTALAHLFPLVHSRRLIMKHQKILLRIESICEAIIYIWMIFYIKQEIFSFKYPNWLTPLVLVALIIHLLCQRKIKILTYSQKIFWAHLIILYTAMLIVAVIGTYCKSINTALGTIFLITFMLVDSWMLSCRNHKIHL